MSKTEELRGAFVAGAEFIREVYGIVRAPGQPQADRHAAKRAYPTPTVTRPREVVIGGMPYRLHDGVIQHKYSTGTEWLTSSTYRLGDGGQLTILLGGTESAHVATILDLIKQPTETVEVTE